MARGDRICFVDKKKYNYCTCKGDDPKDTWRFLFCSQNCRGIEKLWEKFFRDKEISKEEAIETIKSLDLSNIDNFRDQIRDDIKSLIADIEIQDD